MKYFPSELFEKFATESNIYCMRDTGTNLKTTPAKIQKFFEMNMLMGEESLPWIRMYWRPATRIDRVAYIMPVNRFLKIRQYIHAMSAREPPESNKDEFCKIARLSSLLFARLAFNSSGKSLAQLMNK